MAAYPASKRAEPKPEAEARKWLNELRLADKREESWRKQAEKLWERYRSKKERKSSFNILWSNTDTLLPAVYNSDPKPDVRRRFRSEDVIGKAVSEVLSRCLVYTLDATAFSTPARMVVLDALVAGRGVARIRYVPSFTEAPAAAPPGAETETPEREKADDQGDGSTQYGEELEHEQVLTDHVAYDDFRRGSGRTWDEVPWVGFRCRLTKTDVAEKFGDEIAEKVKYDEPQDEELAKKENEDVAETFKTAEFWEIWDKSAKRVFFVNSTCRDQVLFPQDSPNGEPPLKLRGFFPTPEPLRLVDDSGSLTPTPLYELYRKQAEELDRISARINRIVEGLKLRGVYDHTLTELKSLFDGDDNMMIPAQNVTAIMDRGGLDKVIWWMPIERAAQVLKELYLAREGTKQIIYELTGISDIVRGATNPNETLGAQELKANYASVRLKKMQAEVQRYMRDMVRLSAEVIAERFQPETMAQMTGLPIVAQQQKELAQIQAEQIKAAGQPVPMGLQQMLMAPTWDEVLPVLRSDVMRGFRVDVETDSTVAASVESDMKGLRDVLGGLVEFWNGSAAAVQSGALPIEAVKSISLQICRRARMGLEVEDAIEKIQQPVPPQPEPVAAPANDEASQKIDALGQTVMAMAQGQQQADGQYNQALQSLMDTQLQLGQMLQQLGQAQQQQVQMIQQMTLLIATPKRIVRDENGRAQGVELVPMQ